MDDIVNKTLSNLITLATLIATPVFAASQEKLTVYTYSSFASDWGPGPQIEAECV